MKVVDTNILMRLMANDVLPLSEKAAQLVRQHGVNELVIIDAVLVELFFVLENHAQYGFPRATITELFDAIVVPTPQFQVSPTATKALGLFKLHPKLDFTDCLLAVSADMANADLLSFDKDLLRLLR